MALFFRTGCNKLSPRGVITGLCKISPNQGNVAITQVACITGKTWREDRPPRPAPFDWKNKKYSFWHVFFDAMKERMDDNSKIVVIDGLPGIGKDKFAKKLADELEMLYMPAPNFDDWLIDPYGFDKRSLNPQLPLAAQYFDEKMFLADPNGRLSASIQMGFYGMRYSQYLNALAQVFNTGQGVVIQRCPWSDIAFAKAMLTNGYISPGAYNYYKSSLANSLHRILRPHLVIYLDVLAEVSLEKIKRRALPHEKDSKALTLKYLSDVEKNYKEIYLQDISKHAHLLIYDWDTEGDFEFIIDDIERLQFDVYERVDTKMEDWRFSSEDWMRAYRGFYTNDRDELILSTRVSRIDVPELLMTGQEDAAKREVEEKLWEENPSTKYAPGFNPQFDKGILWKTRDYSSDYRKRDPSELKVNK